MKKNQIIKKESSHYTITFVALVPDIQDRNGDIITKDEIINTAHEFMINLQDKEVNIDHTNDSIVDDVQFVESFITPVDIEVSKDEIIPEWSWLVAMKFTPEKFSEIESWDFIWISIEGRWQREEV